MALLGSKAAMCLMCLRTTSSRINSRSVVSRISRGCASYSNTQPHFQFESVPDLEYLLDPANIEEIRENIKIRKGVGNIDLLHELFEEYQKNPDDSVREKLEKAALLIPNKTSPGTIPGNEWKIVKTHEGVSDVARDSFESVCRWQGLLRFQDSIMSTLVYGARSYSLMGDLARLERTLIRWTMDKLRDKGWQYVVVPDMLPEKVVNACGFATSGRQNQVYKVRAEQGGLCFAGTSEIPLAALHVGTRLNSAQPIKVCSYSSCYRAEESRNRVDKGFYRLHQFSKVEMFTVCHPDQSDELLEEIVNIQCELFSELELTYRLVLMPSEELGAPAYKKYDVEAWMNHLKHWGEISSASNCTDYQARRLSITTGEDTYAHTLNGTGCAVPRMLMALVEQNQTEDGAIRVPSCLQSYMKQKYLHPNHKLSRDQMKFVKKRQKFF